MVWFGLVWHDTAVVYCSGARLSYTLMVVGDSLNEGRHKGEVLDQILSVRKASFLANHNAAWVLDKLVAAARFDPTRL